MMAAVDRIVFDLLVIDRTFAVTGVAPASRFCGDLRVGEENPVRRR